MNLVQNYSDQFGNSQRSLPSPTGCVKSTSPKTENRLRKLCTYSMNNNTSDEDKHDTNYINNKYTNTYTRMLHNLWALHLERAVSLHLLMSVSHAPHGSRCSWVSFHPHGHPCVFLSDLTFLPFYFDLTFTVLFHFSFLMHPEQHTEVDNLITMQHNLRTSAKGSNDAFDVHTSLTKEEKKIRNSSTRWTSFPFLTTS